MGQKASVKNQIVEALMDGKAMFSNLAHDIQGIEMMLDANEKLDHDNDKLLAEAVKLLLESFDDFGAQDYGAAESKVRASVQKLHEQHLVDLADDKPRHEIRVALAKIQIKAIYSEKILTNLQARLK